MFISTLQHKHIKKCLDVVLRQANTYKSIRNSDIINQFDPLQVVFLCYKREAVTSVRSLLSLSRAQLRLRLTFLTNNLENLLLG